MVSRAYKRGPLVVVIAVVEWVAGAAFVAAVIVTVVAATLHGSLLARGDKASKMLERRPFKAAPCLQRTLA